MDESKLKELEEALTEHITVLEEAGINTKVEKEKLECTLKFGKTGLLDRMDDHYATCQIATLLENQRLFNEVYKPDFQGDQWAERRHAAFVRCSIPLVRRIFDPRFFVAHSLVSVQTFVGPTGCVRYMKPTLKNAELPKQDDTASLQQLAGPGLEIVTDGEWKLDDSEEAAVKTRKLKTGFDYAQVEMRPKEVRSTLEYEADLVQQISWDVAQLNIEILKDLANNSGTISKSSWEDKVKFWNEIGQIRTHIKNKIGHFPNWIVTSPDICKQLRQLPFEETDYISLPPQNSHIRVIKLGKVYDCDLYENSMCPTGQVVMGYRDPSNPYHSGYFYSPYVGIAPTPIINDPEFCTRPGLLVRYTKKLLRFGHKFYARMDVAGVPQLPEYKGE